MAWMRMMGAESVAYHRETVMGRADDHRDLTLAYYASHGETPLAWGGSGARAFGLGGPVTEAQYDHVFGPGGFRDPTTGTPLVSTRRPGVELVVSAHKSVAVLGVIGFVDEMHAILDAESDATLGALDEWMRASGGRRGRGQVRTPTEGLVWARTRHATSRAGDPEPHDHVLIANIVEMLDERGGRKALDTASIRDQLHAATMIGRLAGARKAIELGFGIEPDAGPSGRLGHWRIAGIPVEACEVFSKRSADIDASMAARGLDSYQARQVAARDTRRAKRHQPVDDLVPLWHAELDQIGRPAVELADSVIETGREQGPIGPPLSRTEIGWLAADVLGPEGWLAEVKVFTRRDVIVAVTPALYGREVADLDRVVDAVVRHPEAIPLLGVAAAREQAYAPACVVAVEAAIVHTMEEGAARTSAPGVAPASIERAVWAKEAELGRPLTVGQTEAVLGMCTSGRGVEIVLGVAGAGKTTMLDVARAAFEEAGYRALGTSTSGQAALTLGREAHVESRTTASLLWRLDHQQVVLDARTVLIVDEAAMADDPALLRLLTAAETAGAKTILVGDHRQLGAVGPSGALEGLAHRFPDAVHVLRDNVRQVDRGERSVLAHLRAGDIGRAVDWYVDHGRVQTGGSRQEVLERMVDAWEADVKRGEHTAMYAWRRANVAELNRVARARWRAEGRIHGPDVDAPGGRRFAAGDLLVTLAPGPDGVLVTSERGVVVAADPEIGRLAMRMADGRQVDLAVGDAGSDRLDHGYAVTVHRSQGETTGRSHRFADGGGRELAYVSMSRATDRSMVHVVAADFDEARAELLQDWTSERRQRWALDTGTPTTAPAEAEHHAGVSTRLRETIREARLRSERDAIAAVIPPDVTAELANANRRLGWLSEQRRTLERGTGGWFYTPEGRAAFDAVTLRQDLARTEHQAQDRRRPRSRRRADRQRAEELRPRVEAAHARWHQLAGPSHTKLSAEIEQLAAKAETLGERQWERTEWLGRHPEALPRLDRLNRELDALRPPAIEVERVVGLPLPSIELGRGIDGPELSL